MTDASFNPTAEDLKWWLELLAALVTVLAFLLKLLGFW